MNRGPAALHRLSVALIGLVALVIGVGMITDRLDVAPVTDWLDRLDTSAVSRFVASGWWPLVLIGIAVITAYWALKLIGSAIRPGKADDLMLAGSDASGSLSVPPRLIASAVADELSTATTLSSSNVKALDDRGRTIIRIVATARPTQSYDQAVATLAPALDHVRTAVEGSDVHVQAFVHLENAT